MLVYRIGPIENSYWAYSRRKRLILMRKALLGALMLGWTPGYAGEKWVRLSTPRFEVFTDAGEAQGREVLRRFEQIRETLLSVSYPLNFTRLDGLPAQQVRIFVLRNESEFAGYKNAEGNSQAGFYQSGRDRDFIVMRNTGDNIYRIVFHEYVHLVLNYSRIYTPLWLNEGTAELFSTAEIAESQAAIGAPIPSHLLVLRSEKMLDLATLMQVDRSSPAYNEQHKAGIFYAESWALAHMLTMSGKYAPALQRFLDLIGTGTPETDALERAYGRTADEVLRDLRDYIQQDRFTRRVFHSERLDKIAAIKVQQVKPSECGLAVADLLINLGKPEEAVRKLRKLASDYPAASNMKASAVRASRIQEALGDAALAQRRQEEALAYYKRAIDLGGASARVYFERAALIRENQDDLNEAIRDLRKAIEIDPDYSQARELLASMELALRTAEPAPARVPDSVSSKVPKSWQNRKGDRRIEAMLVQVDCLGSGARLHALVDSQRIALEIGDPSKVVVTGTPGVSTELSCGPIQPREVTIEYLAKENSGLRTAGEVTALQFK